MDSALWTSKFKLSFTGALGVKIESPTSSHYSAAERVWKLGLNAMQGGWEKE